MAKTGLIFDPFNGCCGQIVTACPCDFSGASTSFAMTLNGVSGPVPTCVVATVPDECDLLNGTSWCLTEDSPFEGCCTWSTNDPVVANCFNYGMKLIQFADGAILYTVGLAGSVDNLPCSTLIEDIPFGTAGYNPCVAFARNGAIRCTAGSTMNFSLLFQNSIPGCYCSFPGSLTLTVHESASC